MPHPNPGFSYKHVLALTLTSLLAVADPLPAFAARPHGFNIVVADASTAVREFGKQAGVQIMVSGDLLKGKRLNPVSGEHTTDAALKIMLEDSGLTHQYVGDKGVVLVPVSAKAATTTANGEQAGVERDLPLVRVAQNSTPQVPATQTPAKAADPATEGEIEVNSTKIDGLNKKSIFQASEEAALPYNVIDREEIARSGASSLMELLRYMPEFTDYGNATQESIGNAALTFNVLPNPSSLNMRGLGAAQTVILVNGRRLSGSNTSAGVDPSRIPIGSIERIEILSAASAAIYGGGAAGGAINIILRRDFENPGELTTYFGASQHGGGEEARLSFLKGMTFNDGRTRLTVTLDYKNTEELLLSQRNYMDRILERFGPNTPYTTGTGNAQRSAFETITLRAFSATPGTIVSNSNLPLGIPGNPTARYASIPAGLTATQANLLTPSSFSATAGQYRLAPRNGRLPLVTPSVNYNAGLQLEQDILGNDRLSMFAEASVGYQKQEFTFPQDMRVTLSATHPFNPFRTAPGFAGTGVTIYLDPTDLPEPYNLQEREDARLTLGFKGKITDRWHWTADLSGQYGKVFADGRNDAQYMQQLATLVVTNAVGVPLTPAQVATNWATYNPLADHSLYPVSPATVPNFADIYRFSQLQPSWNKNAEFSTRVVGEVFDLPAGPIQVSPLADIRIDDSEQYSATVYGTELQNLLGIGSALAARPEVRPGLFGGQSKQTVTFKGAAVEINIPVFSRKWSPVPVEAFEIGLSRRWDESNRASTTAVSDTISGRLQIVRDVMLRASLSDGFLLDRSGTIVRTETIDRPTTLTDPLRGGVSGSVTVPLYITGGNPDLRPASTRSRNYGAVLRPRFAPGLTLNVNYTITQRFDSQGSVPLASLLSTPSDYPGRLERAPLTAEDIQNNYTGGRITKLDLSLMNQSFQEQKSVSYQVNYVLPVPAELGSLELDARTTNNRTNISQSLPSSPIINRINGQGGLLEWRGSSSIFWKRERMQAGLTGNYVNSYSTNTTAPSPSFTGASGIDGRKIEHQIVFDLQLGYETPMNPAGSGWSNLLSGTDIRLGIQNLLDKEPAVVSDQSGFYSRYVNPLQRYLYLQVKKNF